MTHHGYVVEDIVRGNVAGEFVANKLCKDGLWFSNILCDLLVDPWVHSLLNESL